MVQLRSTGRLELVSATDPQAHTRVHYPELVDDNDTGKEDWVAVRRAVRFTMRLAEEFVQNSGYPHKPAALMFGPGMDMDVLHYVTMGRPGERQTTATETVVNEAVGAVLPNPPAAELAPLDKTWRTVTDAEIDAYVRETGQSSLHFGCSCRMAKTAEDGVVDALTSARRGEPANRGRERLPADPERAHHGTVADGGRAVRRLYQGRLGRAVVVRRRQQAYHICISL